MRFVYGLPFAVLWLAFAWAATGRGGGLPPPSPTFLAWTVFAAAAQIAATALLLLNMQERNFALGVAYSKTEVIQVALFGFVLLGDRVSLVALAAIVVASFGVMLLSLPPGRGSLGALLRSWTSRSALLGLGSGAAFGLAAVGYRGATLALAASSVVIAAADTLVWAQGLQTVLLGGFLWWRQPTLVVEVMRAWRVSLLAGAMGAAASAGWFTAMALEPVAQVRTLALVELYFSYIVSRRFFRERLSRAELAGFLLLAVGLLGIVGGH